MTSAPPLPSSKSAYASPIADVLVTSNVDAGDAFMPAKPAWYMVTARVANPNRHDLIMLRDRRLSPQRFYATNSGTRGSPRRLLPRRNAQQHDRRSTVRAAHDATKRVTSDVLLALIGCDSHARRCSTACHYRYTDALPHCACATHATHRQPLGFGTALSKRIKRERVRET